MATKKTTAKKTVSSKRSSAKKTSNNIMTWEKLLCSIRLESEGKSSSKDSTRSDFHRDYDRITFSPSFRRLGKKTQVHPLAQNDHIHSRLTHSLEVSIVGRSLGISVGQKISKKLPPHITPTDVGQILQAASLAHDLGNPPFGHAGEEAIKSWFSHPDSVRFLEGLNENQKDDFKNFEGNAQGFRLVAQIEHNPGEGGMRLTYATLATMLKYPWTTAEIKKVKKFCSFQSEREVLKKVATKVGLIKLDEYRYCRHPLAYLAEASDDICYRILDLEDAHEMGILQLEDILKVLKPLCKQTARYHEIVSSNSTSMRSKLAYLRSKAIGAAIDSVSSAFVKNYDKLMRGKFKGELIDACPDEIKIPLNKAKNLGKTHVYNDTRKVELEIGCYTAIGILLEAFCGAVREKALSNTALSYKSQRVLRLMGVHAPKQGDDLYKSLLKVTDYISGMTDNYASYMAKQIGGMGQ